MRISLLLCCLFLVGEILSKTFPKILWTYWGDDYSSDPLLIMFEQNHRRMAKGWDLRIVNDKNAQQYLKSIPYYKGDLFQWGKNVSELPAHRGDYLRILLLSYYGGVYIDWSILLLDDMSWLQFEALKANPDVENKYGDQPDVLLFTNDKHRSVKTAYIKQLNQTFSLSPGYEIWFFAVKANTTFMRQYLERYWEGRLNGMNQDSTVFDQISVNQKIELRGLYRQNYLAPMTVFQIWFQRLQRQFDRVSEEKGQARKLVPWHYKVWHINSNKGPYAWLFASEKHSIVFTGQCELYPKMSYQQLATFLNYHPKYFIKMINIDRKVLSTYIIQLSQVNISNFVSILRRTQFFIIWKFFCPQKYLIHEPSFLNQYLIKPSSLKDKFKLVSEHYKISDVDENCMAKILLLIIPIVILFYAIKIYKRSNPKDMELVDTQQTDDMEDVRQKQKFYQ